jgi:hypothetical protein
MDKRALKILFDTYWSAKGWLRDDERKRTPPEAFEYAKGAGVMFDPLVIEHDEIVTRLFAARDALTLTQVANAFVASLSTRRLERRSALGSYVNFRHANSHQLPRLMSAKQPEPEDLNVLNFERFKWGGVRHGEPLYAMLDLELFAASPAEKPEETDVLALRRLLDAIDAAPPKTTASNLQAQLGDAFKSNKAERDNVIGILGICGVLATPKHPGFLTSFPDYSSQTLPDRHFVDMAYPACWWTRSVGIHRPSVDKVFGHLL